MFYISHCKSSRFHPCNEYLYNGKKYLIYIYLLNTFYTHIEKSTFAANNRKAIWK